MRQLLFYVTLQDCRIDTYHDSLESMVRITHYASGAVGECLSKDYDIQEQQNRKRNAFFRMTASPEFQSWLKTRIAQQAPVELGFTLVAQTMNPENLKIEVYREGDPDATEPSDPEGF